MKKITFLRELVPTATVRSRSEIQDWMNGTDSFFFREKPSSPFFTLYKVDKKGEPFTYLDYSMGKKSSYFLAQFLLNTNPSFGVLFKELGQGKIADLLLIMWQVSAVNYGSLIKGGMSYCSHSEGYLTTLKNSGFIREKYERFLSSNFDILSKLYLKAKERVNPNLFGINQLKQNISVSISKGEIFFYKDAHEEATSKNTLMKSQFHKALWENKGFQNRLVHDNNFKSSRFITISEYLWLRTLGTDLNMRMFYCYICYRTIEKVEQLKYVDLAKR